MNKKDSIALGLIFFLTPLILLICIAPFSNRALMGEIKTMTPVEVLLTREISPEGIVTQTIDASQNKWVYLNFRNGILPPPDGEKPKEIRWDLAFQRKRIISNSPPITSNGDVGVINTGVKDFTADFTLPDRTFVKNTVQKGKIINPAIDHWYDYDFMKHSLTPKEEIYLVRSTEQKVVKMKIESYYCGSENIPACYTLRFAWLP
ncbi:MAG: HmuY family protein [Nitrospinota bacterium]